MIAVNVKMAFSSMRSAKIRSFLTMLGVIIGVASVVLTVSLGEGIKNEVVGKIEETNSSRIVVVPGKPIERDQNGRVTGINIASLLGSSSLNEKDFTLVAALPGVQTTVPFAIISSSPTAPGQLPLPSVFVAATTSDAPKVINQKVVEGSFFEEEDAMRNLAIIGSDVAEAFFQDSAPIGRKISIRGTDFIVRGVLERSTTPNLNFGLSYNSAILIPIEAGKRINNSTIDFQEIQVLATDGSKTPEVAIAIEENLAGNHAGQIDFSVFEKDEFLSITDQLFRVITAFVAAVAGISLFVGGVGIMNIMLVSVTERTKEIGIRKALGASNSQILSQFLVEAVALSFMGGVIGVGLAIVAGVAITVSTDLQPSFEPKIIIVAFAVSTLIGIVFGITPALKASRKDPIESLRHN